MRVDIYRRPEWGGQFSYLAVPEGSVIPGEATNVDWEAAERSVDLEDSVERLPQFSIDDPIEQITSKGYAITSVRTLGDGELPM
ncbi:hypothetical protein D3878_15415 [Noviherbaspirillum sedimenti]|uniref:YcgL domain-containing protein n=2 Tax=Noviherbaspirillum sedimenti TaxID=2320865 RepID=A0A3A3GKF9_9BURK|nr:DUF6139 family protein [Noviherbaspirillum sedimenti]RJG02796.1 hypothetical protein D3878_15415 [Noviherbaspirillum sedimenti]